METFRLVQNLARKFSFRLNQSKRGDIGTKGTSGSVVTEIGFTATNTVEVRIETNKSYTVTGADQAML